MEQLTEEGLFTGGSVPYGYRLVKTGRTNKRNKEVFDIEQDEAAAEIIRLIFYKYVHEGYGAQRLCKYLAEMHIYKENGKNFPNTTINRIIKNEIYTGVMHNGEARSEVIPELQIIDRETFDRAQKIMRERTMPHNDVPLNLKGQSLLVGNVFCGYCGNRLTLTTSGYRNVHADGSCVRAARARYACHYKQRHPGECEGPSGYGIKTLDGLVDRVVKSQLQRIKDQPTEELLSSQQQEMINLMSARCKILSLQVNDKQQEIADYEAETIKVIRGQSKFSAELLTSLSAKAKEELDELKEALEEAQAELDRLQSEEVTDSEEYDRLVGWADVYDRCSFETKKMFVSQFIKSVRVFRDYQLEIDFNVSYEEFQNLTVNQAV